LCTAFSIAFAAIGFLDFAALSIRYEHRDYIVSSQAVLLLTLRVILPAHA
jgi:hypothetical protein